jgi:hypothetical protein
MADLVGALLAQRQLEAFAKSGSQAHCDLLAHRCDRRVETTRQEER